MTEDTMWDDFAGAVVHLEAAGRDALLEPRLPGDVGLFEFAEAVYIVTAYNPAGLEIDGAANVARHRDLTVAVEGLKVISTVGSAPDGSFAEPGFGLVGVSLSDALDLAREFGQRAIYEWTAEALTIVGVDEPHRRVMGWALS